MKKILLSLLLIVGLSLTAEAQTFKISEKKIDAEKQATIDINEIVKLVEIEDYLIEDLKTLQVMRYNAMNDTELLESKIAVNKRFAIKIQGAFNEEQLAKLNTKPELYNRIFVY